MNNYKNMSDEEIKEQLEWSDHHEFSYGYSIWTFEKIKQLEKENQQLKKERADVVECCNKSIKSINEKLENNKEPFEVVDGKIICLNDYQVVRLKAIRMKCKEILRMLGEIE